MRKVWSNAEIEFIKANAATLSDKELAIQLSKIRGRKITMACVRKQRQRLLLKKVGGRGKKGLAPPTPVVTPEIRVIDVTQNTDLNPTLETKD